ncbi:FAD-dependent monooxygenase [Labedaea rhizosphaerae]|uniref:Oxygenase n=1 Tax=Labedaea rhizosphaerae TaxID=598644 RepID=A0A4R6RUI3_LABRH|nr:FAD-dependent monooxygenase [Labedaea rhizosphaerae]TDP90582.1 oxygenase [Labedaea rhizosphaerae]
MAVRDTEGTEVVVVGAGPVGLLLAGELRLAGVRVTVLEKLTEPTTESRASALHARTMEFFDQRGLLDGLGTLPNLPHGHFGGIPLDLMLPGLYPGQWKLPQAETEKLLWRWATGLGADVRRGHELTGLTATAAGVEAEVTTATGTHRLQAEYLVGCDGEQSAVRGLAGFAFPGADATIELIRADLRGIEIPDRRFERHENGLATAYRYPDGLTRVMVHEFGSSPRRRDEEPAFAEIVAAWARVTGEDIGAATPVWLNAFGDTRRQAAAYRQGRVLLAGDAAHRQLPSGGQALNLGLQDAANLGWKLAARVRGHGSESLVDSYHDERHPVGARVLTNVAAQALLLFGDRRVDATRAVLAELLATEPARTHVAAMVSGLDTRYDVGPSTHPLLGAPLPFHRLGGGHTTFSLLRKGTGVLLDLTGDPGIRDVAQPWADRVRAVSAIADDAPGFGAALVRPDGHLAWVDGTRAELETALARWFGPALPQHTTSTTGGRRGQAG